MIHETKAELPLAGIRVVDVATVIAAPHFALTAMSALPEIWPSSF